MMNQHEIALCRFDNSVASDIPITARPNPVSCMSRHKALQLMNEYCHDGTCTHCGKDVVRERTERTEPDASTATVREITGACKHIAYCDYLCQEKEDSKRTHSYFEYYDMCGYCFLENRTWYSESDSFTETASRIHFLTLDAVRDGFYKQVSYLDLIDVHVTDKVCTIHHPSPVNDNEHDTVRAIYSNGFNYGRILKSLNVPSAALDAQAARAACPASVADAPVNSI